MNINQKKRLNEIIKIKVQEKNNIKKQNKIISKISFNNNQVNNNQVNNNQVNDTPVNDTPVNNKQDNDTPYNNKQDNDTPDNDIPVNDTRINNNDDIIKIIEKQRRKYNFYKNEKIRI